MTGQYEAAMGSELERTNAMSVVRFAWWVLLVLPLAAFAVVVGTLAPGTAGKLEGLGLLFFVLALVWLALLAPPAYILRAHCFRAAWRGKPVEPESYIRGLITVWMVLEGVAILSLAACVAATTLLPGILPGALALMLLALSGPSPRALGLSE